jgi:hypothetical protein
MINKRRSDAGLGMAALGDLRAARRRRYVEDLDVMEILYRLYVGTIFGAWALVYLASLIADAHVDDHTVSQITRNGPAILGLAVAVALAAALRSGARGGPLAIQAAEVQHVLLAPIDRTAALRGPALRQLRTAGFVGTVAGLVIANFVFRRLPGTPVEWFWCLAVFGAAVPVWMLAAAMVGSGRRLRQDLAGVIGLATVAWSLADLLLKTTTSPATMLGEFATLPLQNGVEVALGLVGLAVVAISVYLALGWLGGISLEAARRRAALAAELRFAATVQDLRTVVLLRRQLASEHPRANPWRRLRPSSYARHPVWRRGWQSFLRWPAARAARLLVIGVATGLVICGAWSGTTPLIALAGLVMLVAGLDAVEPLAQEVDHPTRRDLLPVDPARLTRTHLLAPAAVIGVASLVAVLTAVILGSPARAVGVGAVMVVPTAVLIVCCAALSATNDPYAYVLNPGIGYMQTAAPLVLAIGGVAGPALAAREAARHGHSAALAAAGAEPLVLIVCAGAIWWLGRRVAKRVAVNP